MDLKNIPARLMRRFMNPIYRMQRAAREYHKQKRYVYKHSAKTANRSQRRMADAILRSASASAELKAQWITIFNLPPMIPAKRVIDKRGRVAYVPAR